MSHENNNAVCHMTTRAPGNLWSKPWKRNHQEIIRRAGVDHWGCRLVTFQIYSFVEARVLARIPAFFHIPRYLFIASSVLRIRHSATSPTSFATCVQRRRTTTSSGRQSRLVTAPARTAVRRILIVVSRDTLAHVNFKFIMNENRVGDNYIARCSLRLRYHGGSKVVALYEVYGAQAPKLHEGAGGQPPKRCTQRASAESGEALPPQRWGNVPP